MFFEDRRVRLEALGGQVGGLEASWRLLEALGGILEALGGILEDLGGILEDLGRILEDFGGQDGSAHRGGMAGGRAVEREFVRIWTRSWPTHQFRTRSPAAFGRGRRI